MSIDIIEVLADEFCKRYIDRSAQKHDEIISAARNKLYDIDDQGDKIKFINILLKRSNSAYKRHKKVCTAKVPKDCPDNVGYEALAYFLSQELTRLGVPLNDDTFTNEERNQTDVKLDQILRDLGEIKAGQEVIFNEINELKDLYYLGKKKWYQLLIGKTTEMVVGGVVSESISAQIVSEVKKVLPSLLG